MTVSGRISGTVTQSGAKKTALKPVWQTSAGSLAIANAGTQVSIQLQATDPNTPPLALTYKLAGGALPQGITLSASGLVSGVLPPVASNTVFSFTVAVSNGTYAVKRSFSLTDNHVASLPTPSACTVTPAAATIYDNSAAGTQLATYAFTMSDGSPFTGPVTITSPSSGFALSSASGNGAIETSQALAAGSYTVDISGSQNGGSTTGSFALTVSASSLAPYISGNTYFGTPGNDTFTVTALPWPVTVIQGNGGTDTVVFPSDYSFYKFFLNSDGSVTTEEVHATGQTITCIGITTFQFSGGVTIPVSQVPLSTGTGGGGTGGGGGGGSTATTIPLYPTGPATASSTHLTAIVVFGDGTTWNFAEDSAVDMGDYVDPAGAFTQHCRLHAPSGIPMAVWFRPDAGGARDEVIFELGQQAFAPVADVPAYTATIKRSGTTLATISVNVPANNLGITTTSAHYWGSRWRWQSAARTVRKIPADLFAAKQVFHYDNALVVGDTPQSSTFTASPMCFSSVGLTDYMPTTGERSDIGLVTEQTGEWLCTATSKALGNMIAQAEAAASVPWHFRDDTGAPCSIVRYPSANAFWENTVGSPWFQIANCLNATITNAGQTSTYVGPVITPDVAHPPALAYVAFLVTGDPYYLEELQFVANFTILNENPAYRQYALGLFRTDQTRGWAWTARSFLQALLATPASVPAWLLPQSYWSTILEANRQNFDQVFVNDTTGNPLIDTMHFCIDVSANHIAAWQQDMLSSVLGYIGYAGLGWATEFAFQVQQALTRTNNSTSYPRSQAIDYYYTTDGVTDWPTLASVNGLTPTMDGNFPSSWWTGSGAAPAYPGYLRGALAAASLQGISGVATPLAYVNGQITIGGGLGAVALPYKWAFRSS